MSNELSININANPQGLKDGLKDAEKQISGFVSKVEKIGQLGDVLQNLGTKLTAGVTLPLVGLGVAAVKAFGDIEALKKGLEAVTGSADKAEVEFNKLKEVAKLPGLGMEEAVKGSINLQAIGMSADKSRKVLSQFGNAVATVGKGRAEFERAVYGVQQLANTDFPLGEDLNIIKDALPQVSKLLKEAFGTSRSDELTKMGISSQQVLDTILTGLEKLPRVSGGIKGAFENLSDSMKTSLGRIGAIINKNLDISKLVDNITNLVDKAVTAFENLSPSIQKTILVIAGLAAAAGPLIAIAGTFMTMLPTLIAGVGALKVAFAALTGPIGLTVLGITAIITAVVSNWDKIKPYLDTTIKQFRTLYEESTAFRLGVQAIIMSFKTFVSVAGTALGTIWQNFKTVGKGILNLFSNVGEVIIGALTLDASKIKSGLLGGFKAVNDTIVGTLGNNANALKIIGDEFKKNLADTLGLKGQDFKLPGLKDKVEDEITNELANKPLKAKKPVKVELPDIEFIGGGGKGFFNQLGTEFSSATDLAMFYDDLGNRMQNSINATAEKLRNSATPLRESTKIVSQVFADMANSIEQSIGTFIGDSVSDMFSSIGEALGSGGNVISAIGQSLLASFSGFLSNMGKMMAQYGGLLIAYGVAEAVLKNSPEPASKIAAGAALVAIGAALSLAGGAIKGASSSGGGSASGGAGGGTSSYSSSYSSGGNGGGEYVFRINGNDLVAVLSRNLDRNQRLNAG